MKEEHGNIIFKSVFFNIDFKIFAVYWMLYVFFWVIPWRLNFICRRFGTICLFHLHRWVGMKYFNPTRLRRSKRQIVPKRRDIKFRRREITQNKIHKNNFFFLIVDKWKTNLMSLAILFHLLCAQHVSDINISMFRSLRLCCWITTSVVLFSVRCVLEIWCGWCWVVLVLQAEAQLCFSLQNEHHSKPAAPNLQHTTNWEQDDRCVNSSTQPQAPDDGCINIRNMLST